MPPDHRVDIDVEAIQEFLKKKGSVELLIVLGESDLRHDELESEIPVSGSTFHVRRNQAGDLGLITRESRRPSSDEGFVDFYTLTEVGEIITQQARSEGLSKMFWRLQELREQYEEARDTIPEWVGDEESNFVDDYVELRIHGREQDAYDRGDFY